MKTPFSMLGQDLSVITLVFTTVLASQGLASEAPKPCKDCITITNDRFHTTLGLLEQDRVVRIEGRSSPLTEAELDTLAKSKTPIPALHIIRSNIPSVLMSCLAIPTSVSRYRNLIETLPKTPSGPGRDKLVTELYELLNHKLPADFGPLNTYVWETPEKSCQSRTLHLCQSQPLDSKVCPPASQFPMLKIFPGEEVAELELDYSALVAFFKKLNYPEYTAYFEFRQELAATDGLKYLHHSDAGDCTDYGEGKLSKTCFTGFKLVKKFPKFQILSEFVDWICQPLKEPSTMCSDSAEGFFREMNAYLKLDASSPEAARVKGYLKDFPSLIPQLSSVSWAAGRPWDQTSRPAQKCKPNPSKKPRFLGEYEMVINDPPKLVLFANGERCEGLLSYQATDIYLAPEHCTLKGQKLTFSFLDSGGFGQKSFTKQEHTSIQFQGEFVKTELHGSFLDVGNSAKLNTRWTKNIPQGDSLRTEFLQHFLTSLRTDVCSGE